MRLNNISNFMIFKIFEKTFQIFRFEIMKLQF